jgi:MoxR-like ATPase
MNTPATAQPASPARLEPEAFADRARRIEDEIGQVIVGQRDLVRQTMTGLLANSHVLLEGVPGLGKTMLVRTIADVIDCSFNRIQFTPDLMPADITGTNILVEEGGSRVFRFQQGPIFANLVLADEINRATPKTQSSLLEAMQEHQVSVARQRFPLEAPFFVLATQNPLEMEGTYPLPEAQLDRFLFKVMVPFPSEDDLIAIMDRTTGAEYATASKVCTAAEIVEMQRLARAVPIAPCHRIRGQHPPPPPTRTTGGLRSSSAIVSVTAARRAAPRPWSPQARSSLCSTGASTSRPTTSGPRPCPRCATGSSSTSRARPRESRPSP